MTTFLLLWAATFMRANSLPELSVPFSEGRVCQLSDLDELLCQPNRKRLEVKGDLKKVCCYIKSTKSDPQSVLNSVAKASNATLTSLENGWELKQTSEQIKADLDQEKWWMRDVYGKALKDSLASSSKNTAEMTLLEAQGIREKVKNIGDRSLPANQRRLAELKENGPVYRLTRRILKRIPAPSLGDLSSGTIRKIYALNPTEAQARLPMDVSDLLTQFDREVERWNTAFGGFELAPDKTDRVYNDGVPQGFLTRANGPISNVVLILDIRSKLLVCSLKAYNKTGQFVAGATDAFSIRSQFPNPPSCFEGPPAFRDSSMAYFKATQFTLASPEVMSELANILKSEQRHEPLNTWVCDGLKSTLSKSAEVVAILPDIGEFRLDPQHLLSDEALTSTISMVSDSGTVMFRPTRYASYKKEVVDRSKVQSLIKALLPKKVGHLADLTSTVRYLPRESFSSDFFARLTKRCIGKWLASASTESDLRVFDVIPADWRSQGGSWRAANWPPALKDEIRYWLYCNRDFTGASKFDKSSGSSNISDAMAFEATTAFPYGVPDDSVLTITTKKGVELGEVRDASRLPNEFANASTFGYRLVAQRRLRDFDCDVAVAEAKIYTATVMFAPGLTMTFRVTDREITSLVRHVSELPSDIQKEILDWK